ncbi:MAG TPA: hypothetical protein VM581_04525 [Magnetospirillaceae bacterium]|nr:hypothetical protein [Magnetospirillaceae bacterium]
MIHSRATQTCTSLLLVLAVFMSGIHSKDLAVPFAATFDAQKKIDDTHQSVKIAHDLHHHGDNAVKVHAPGDGHQTDTRSLRLLHRHKASVFSNRLADRLRLWWHLTSLNVS